MNGGFFAQWGARTHKRQHIIALGFLSLSSAAELVMKIFMVVPL
jgi:hypothetical protein